jgi:hypothetical protein
MRYQSDSSAIIATWLVADAPQDASVFPQTGLDSASTHFQQIYWRCVACFFATSVRMGNAARHLFFTNVERLPNIDGFSLDELFLHLGVEVRTLPITHRLGRSKVSTWNNQFYVLDIIKDLHARQEFQCAAVLDSDCVWVRRADEFLADIGRRGVLTLCIPYALDFKVNRGSRQDLRQAALQLAGKALLRDPYYAGGELFAATRDNIGRIYELAAPMWQRLQASEPGEIPIYEEGHFLSIVYELLDIPIGTADPHIRRMWTALRLYNVTWEDIHSSRCVWHLPMEKKTGFVELFAAVRNTESWFWAVPPDQLRPRIAAAMGMPRPSPRQWLNKARSRAMDHIASWSSEFLRDARVEAGGRSDA